MKGVRKKMFFFQAEDGIRDHCVTGVQTCALPICLQFAELSQKLPAGMEDHRLLWNGKNRLPIE